MKCHATQVDKIMKWMNNGEKTKETNIKTIHPN